MISAGNGDVGAAKLTGVVFDIMERLPHVVQGMTGVDIAKVGNSMMMVTFSEFKGKKLLGYGLIYEAMLCGGRGV